ncbi:AI-2E family transporter [Nordella sp. HKS 07]|uniref:AI-2E family transporter n=1 Tax=Nordella sp. HKS 07 TaxID=2712222 RepID=UPI0013E1493B|nr:AI-2E family transporter [Nordella sp. HKS 07]QIG47498.1 AI-2E family transporter [Nordella sp. HKS 07]
MDLGPVDRETAALARLHLSKPVSFSIIGIFVILLVGALYFARSFFLPVMLALLITLTFSPMVRYLRRHGVPSAVSAVLLVLVLFAFLGSASLYLSDPISQIISDLPTIAQRIEERFAPLREPLRRVMSASAQLEELADTAGPAAEKVVVAQSGLAGWAANALGGLSTTLGATLVLVVFLLSSGDLFLHKVVRILPTLSDKKRSVRLVHNVEFEVSRYLLTITAINLGFGAAVATAMWFLGMPNPLLWGAVATALNFIPYVGAAIGVGATFVAALITYGTIGPAFLAPAAYLLFHTLESAFITPLILGRRLELNVVVIFISLAFWGWIWGIVGALIAVPILVVIKVFCDNFPGLAHFGEFLSGTPPAAEPLNGEE